MKKLLLDADALRVETFVIARPTSARGTVAGAAAIGGYIATDDSKAPDCDLSGSPTCGYSFCAENTCGTCDHQSYCGNSCVLVCDGVADPAAG